MIWWCCNCPCKLASICDETCVKWVGFELISVVDVALSCNLVGDMVRSRDCNIAFVPTCKSLPKLLS